MRNLERFLAVCAETERMASDFYACLAKAFAQCPGAAEVFREMAEDEGNHARTFDMLRSVATQQNLNAAVQSNFDRNVERMRRGIERAVKSVEAENGLQLADAIGFGLLIESTTLERDKASFVDVDDQHFQKTLKDLICGDEAHRKRLEQLRETLAA